MEVLIVAIHKWKQYHMLSSTAKQLKTLTKLEEIAQNVITNTLDSVASEYRRLIPRWAVCLVFLNCFIVFLFSDFSWIVYETREFVECSRSLSTNI
jgi:hypothetical protein